LECVFVKVTSFWLTNEVSIYFDWIFVIFATNYNKFS